MRCAGIWYKSGLNVKRCCDKQWSMLWYFEVVYSCPVDLIQDNIMVLININTKEKSLETNKYQPTNIFWPLKYLLATQIFLGHPKPAPHKSNLARESSNLGFSMGGWSPTNIDQRQKRPAHKLAQGAPDTTCVEPIILEKGPVEWELCCTLNHQKTSKVKQKPSIIVDVIGKVDLWCIQRQRKLPLNAKQIQSLAICLDCHLVRDKVWLAFVQSSI